MDGANPSQLHGYVVATHPLNCLLALLPSQLTRGQSVSLTELDGTRLAVQGLPRRGTRVFVAQQVLDLPGAPLVLRLEGARQLPDVFPNVLTALVTGLSIALVTVLVLLARDFRARQEAEAALAQALSFRKAMEDSLVTGLRARDLQGRITYVNPAFSDMVGYAADQLVGPGAARQEIVARASVQGVVPVPAVEFVHACAAVQVVLAGPAREQVVARAAGKVVLAPAAEQRVVPGPAGEAVVALAHEDQIPRQVRRIRHDADRFRIADRFALGAEPPG